MSNRIEEMMKSGKKDLLTVYFTAGFPELEDTRSILRALQDSGADMVEIGLPYSDPVADGSTIQQSNMKALENGMSISLLFSQLESMRAEIDIPVILMGYFNPVLQYGVDAFCKKCHELGIDGLIIPDLPPEVYQHEYETKFNQYELLNICMITPQTTEQRIRLIDKRPNGFIYMVSSASITGEKREMTDEQVSYFERIRSMKLNNPTLIGFGISDHEQFGLACEYARGAIIGSAFSNALEAG
jgi:tryptophan synthase alpha chain